MGVGDLRHASAALPPRKRPGTHLIGDWVGPRANLQGCWKSCPPSGFDPRTVQPVGSRYTDWTIAAPIEVRGKAEFVHIMKLCVWLEVKLHFNFWIIWRSVARLKSRQLSHIHTFPCAHWIWSWGSSRHIGKFQGTGKSCDFFWE